VRRSAARKDTKLARTSRIALAALTALALAPALITSAAVQAGPYNGSALTDFDSATPAGASVYLTVQSTAPDQTANLLRIGNLLGPKVTAAINGETGGSGSGSSGGTTAQFTTIIGTYRAIFNGEYAVAVLSTTPAKGATLPDALLELGLQKGATGDTLVSSLKLLGISAKPAKPYKGVQLQAVDLGSLTALAGGVTGGAVTPGSKGKAAPAYLGVLGNDAVVGTTATAIDAAIDAFKGSAPSLGKSSNYAKTVGKLPKGRFVTTYVNVSNSAGSSVVSAAGLGAGCKAAPTTPGTFSAGFSMSAASDGLLFNTSPVIATGSLATSTKMQATAGGAVELFPSSTLAFASLGNPGALIAQVVKAASQSGSLSALGCSAADPLAAFTKATGLDLNADVLSWMQGDLSVAVLPVGSAAYTDKGDPLAESSVVVALKVANQSLAESKMTKIVNALNAHSTKAERVKVIVVKGPGGVAMHVASKSPTGLGYAFYKGYLLLATSLPADLGVVQTGGGGVSGPLKSALSHFGSGPFGGTLFVNLTTVRELIEKATAATMTPKDLKTYNSSVKPLLSLFTGFSAVVYANGNGTAAFLGIGK
jgi:hypothetical protein